MMFVKAIRTQKLKELRSIGSSPTATAVYVKHSLKETERERETELERGKERDGEGERDRGREGES
jgi:hypothetical protein